eukprot:3941792-Rhodomonas_salina.3
MGQHHKTVVDGSRGGRRPPAKCEQSRERSSTHRRHVEEQRNVKLSSRLCFRRSEDKVGL